jgi:hypothetical protein
VVILSCLTTVVSEFGATISTVSPAKMASQPCMNSALLWKPHNVGTIALQETNLDFTKQWVPDQVESILAKHFDTVRLVTSTSCVRSPLAWKPGGVLLVVLSIWSRCVATTHSDDLGRWASATFTGHDGCLFTLYSLYNCVDVHITDVGPSTAYAQQWQLLCLAGIKDPKPRMQCVQDLSHDIWQRQLNDEGIMIVGDFNKTLGKDTTLMASVCTKYSLYDVVDNLHGSCTDVPTYNRGTRRLDYCLLFFNLQSDLQATGFNLFNEYASSDRRILFVDFNLSHTLGKPNPAVVARAKCSVSSRSNDVYKFVSNISSRRQGPPKLLWWSRVLV